MLFLLLLLPFLSSFLGGTDKQPEDDKNMSELENSLKRRKDIPKQTDYIIKHVETCPRAGYFFKRELSSSLSPGSCYLCFCQGHSEAICWRRLNHKCDDQHYHHHGVGMRHTLPPSALYAVTGVSIPPQLRSTPKPSFLDSALGAAGYNKISEQQPETFKETGTEGPSFLDSALAAVGYEKLKENNEQNNVQSQHEEQEQSHEPGLLEQAVAVFGGGEKSIQEEVESLPPLPGMENEKEEPGLIDKAMAALGYGKNRFEDEESAKTFPEDVIAPSMVDRALSAVGFGKADESPEYKPKRRNKRSPGFTDIFFRDATRSAFDKEVGPESCKPYESSFSEGCPPVDWCIGCTVCDCDANGRWDCHILSFCDEGDKKRIAAAKNKKLRRKEYRKRAETRHMLNDFLGNPKMRDKSAYKIVSYKHSTTSEKAPIQRRAIATKKKSGATKKKGSHGKKTTKKPSPQKPLRRSQMEKTQKPKKRQTKSTTTKPKPSKKKAGRSNQTKKTAKTQTKRSIVTRSPKPQRKRKREGKPSFGYSGGDLQISKRSVPSSNTGPLQTVPPPFMVPATPEGKAYKKALVSSISRMLADNRKIEKQKRLQTQIHLLVKEKSKLKTRYKRSVIKKVALNKGGLDLQKKGGYNKTVKIQGTHKQKRNDHMTDMLPNLVKPKRRLKRDIDEVYKNHMDASNKKNVSNIDIPTTTHTYNYYVYSSDKTIQNQTAKKEPEVIDAVKNEKSKNSSKRSIMEIDIGDKHQHPPEFGTELSKTSYYLNEETKPDRATDNISAESKLVGVNGNCSNCTNEIAETSKTITFDTNVALINQSVHLNINVSEELSNNNVSEILSTMMPTTLLSSTTTDIPEDTETSVSKLSSSTIEPVTLLLNTLRKPSHESLNEATSAGPTLSNILSIVTDKSLTTTLFQIPEPKLKVSSKDIGRKIRRMNNKYKMKKIVHTLNNNPWREEKIYINNLQNLVTTRPLIKHENHQNYKTPLEPQRRVNVDSVVGDFKKFFKKMMQGIRQENNSTKNIKQKGTRMLKYLQRFFKNISNKKSKHKHTKGKALKLALDRQKIIQTVCDTFGPCNVETFKNKKILNKIDDLNEKTYEMLRTIKTIQGLLNLVQIGKINRDIKLNHKKGEEKKFKDDVLKLQAILKDTYKEGSQVDKLTCTQMTQIDYVKANVQSFIKSAGKFANILNDVIDTVVSDSKNNNSKRSLKYQTIDAKTTEPHHSITTEQPLAKLKQLLIKYDMIQNAFMHKIFKTISNISPIFNATKVDKHEGQESDANNKASEMKSYAKNIIDNLRKLKHLALNLNITSNSPRRRKRELEDDESMEYLLVLMEYLLRTNIRKDVPAHDGIDLIIEAIKHAPDIKPIKKKVLLNAMTPSYSTTSSNVTWKDLNISTEYNDSNISYINNKIDDDNDSEMQTFKKYDKSNSVSQDTEERETNDIINDVNEDVNEEEQNVNLRKSSERSTTEVTYSSQRDEAVEELAPNKKSEPEIYGRRRFNAQTVTESEFIIQKYSNEDFAEKPVLAPHKKSEPEVYGGSKFNAQTAKESEFITQKNFDEAPRKKSEPEIDGRRKFNAQTVTDSELIIQKDSNEDISEKPVAAPHKSDINDINEEEQNINLNKASERSTTEVTYLFQRDEVVEELAPDKKSEPETYGRRRFNAQTATDSIIIQKNSNEDTADKSVIESKLNNSEYDTTTVTEDTGYKQTITELKEKENIASEEVALDYYLPEKESTLKEIFDDKELTTNDLYERDTLKYSTRTTKNIDKDRDRYYEEEKGDISKTIDNRSDDIKDKRTDYNLEKLPNIIDDNGQKSLEITEGVMEDESSHQFLESFKPTTEKSKSRTNTVNNISTGDDSFGHNENTLIAPQDWLEEKFAEEIKYQTEVTSNSNLNATKGNETNNVKGAESISVVTKEDEDIKREKLNTKDIMYKKEIDFLNSLDYGTDEIKKPDTEESREESNDKYFEEKFSPFYQ